MATLDFIEKQKIDRLLNNGGYVLDFTNETYRQFVIDKTGRDLYLKYGLSKGKNLAAVIANESDITVGKLLLELLAYMQAFEMINDDNRALFKECAGIGDRLIGRKSVIRVSSPDKPAEPPQPCDSDLFLRELVQLSSSRDTPQSRGYAFERYLSTLFKASGLDPRGAFKIAGEQIDGSFVLKDEVYLLEAKWTNRKTDKTDLVVFNSKVSSKSGFTRGLFISFSGYTDEALATLSNGSVVRIILMTVQELAIWLENKRPLADVLWAKVRSLAEEGDFNKLVY